MSKPHVIDATAANFQQDVAQVSMTKPVLVDFYADWCEPCKQLTPNLEKLAAEYNGAFLLAKVDTEVEAELAQMFQIQSLPTVMIVHQGRALDSFQGALPIGELRKMLDTLFQHLNITVEREEVIPTEPGAAAAYWRKKHDDSPEDGKPALELGRLLVAAGDLDEAKIMLEKIQGVAPEYSAARAALATMELLGQVAEAGGEAAVEATLAADPEDPRGRYLAACSQAGRGHFLVAVTAFVDLVGKSNPEVKEDAKKAAAIVFEAAGRNDPEVELQRRRLARFLF